MNLTHPQTVQVGGIINTHENRVVTSQIDLGYRGCIAAKLPAVVQIDAQHMTDRDTYDTPVSRPYDSSFWILALPPL